MEITKTQVEKIRITEIKNCDPIEVMFEDLGPRQGQVFIRCYNKAWSSWWGGIGYKGIKAFFKSCDKYYLTKNFMTSDEMTEPDFEGTIKNFKRHICTCHREGEYTQERARELYDSLEWCSDIYEIRESECGTIDQWHELIIEKPTSNCFWLRDRIIPTIKEALSIIPQTQTTNQGEQMSEYKNYVKNAVQPLRPYVPGEDLTGVSISEEDKKNGSPKVGDMIAKNPKSLGDRWLVAKKFFEDNYIEA